MMAAGASRPAVALPLPPPVPTGGRAPPPGWLATCREAVAAAAAIGDAATVVSTCATVELTLAATSDAPTPGVSPLAAAHLLALLVVGDVPRARATAASLLGVPRGELPATVAGWGWEAGEGDWLRPRPVPVGGPGGAAALSAMTTQLYSFDEP
ncbi:hypothetical protein I4F81_011109 [Pyropia yezoensis]|uniref:Uncharacterized protein n=1 Tax=Pyropia yezoensis TaxID=2788 RepID=A0ACC3CEC6_PYRYE|nr:hypothetical protein I4F81_011109 [Neopyropia yezoensis]